MQLSAVDRNLQNNAVILECQIAAIQRGSAGRNTDILRNALCVRIHDQLLLRFAVCVVIGVRLCPVDGEGGFEKLPEGQYVRKGDQTCNICSIMLKKRGPDPGAIRRNSGGTGKIAGFLFRIRGKERLVFGIQGSRCLSCVFQFLLPEQTVDHGGINPFRGFCRKIPIGDLLCGGKRFAKIGMIQLHELAARAVFDASGVQKALHGLLLQIRECKKLLIRLQIAVQIEGFHGSGKILGARNSLQSVPDDAPCKKRKVELAAVVMHQGFVFLGEKKKRSQNIRFSVAVIVKPLDQLPAVILPVAAANQINAVLCGRETGCFNIHGKNTLSSAKTGKRVFGCVAVQFSGNDLHDNLS